MPYVITCKINIANIVIWKKYYNISQSEYIYKNSLIFQLIQKQLHLFFCLLSVSFAGVESDQNSLIIV